MECYSEMLNKWKINQFQLFLMNFIKIKGILNFVETHAFTLQKRVSESEISIKLK